MNFSPNRGLLPKTPTRFFVALHLRKMKPGLNRFKRRATFPMDNSRVAPVFNSKHVLFAAGLALAPLLCARALVKQRNALKGALLQRRSGCGCRSRHRSGQ